MSSCESTIRKTTSCGNNIIIYQEQPTPPWGALIRITCCIKFCWCLHCCVSNYATWFAPGTPSPFSGIRGSWSRSPYAVGRTSPLGSLGPIARHHGASKDPPSHHGAHLRLSWICSLPYGFNVHFAIPGYQSEGAWFTWLSIGRCVVSNLGMAIL